VLFLSQTSNISKGEKYINYQFILAGTLLQKSWIPSRFPTVLSSSACLCLWRRMKKLCSVPEETWVAVVTLGRLQAVVVAKILWQNLL